MPLQMGADQVRGWAAIIVSWLAFGTFAVPMKSRSVVRVGLDPFIFQTYKSIAVAAFSCGIAAARAGAGTQTVFLFAPQPIYAALCWVPGGVFAVTAVRTAGLGVSTAVWSCTSVLSSFLWGALFFGESLHGHTILAVTGVLLICVGVCVMVWSSTPPSESAVASFVGAHTLSPRYAFASITSPSQPSARHHAASFSGFESRASPVSKSGPGRGLSWITPPRRGTASDLGVGMRAGLLADCCDDDGNTCDAEFGRTGDVSGKAGRNGETGEGRSMYEPSHCEIETGASAELDGAATTTESGSAHFRAAGVVCAVIAGFLSGTMYIPLSMKPDTVDGVTYDALAYTVLFGLAGAVVTLVLLAGYILLLRVSGRPAPRFHARTTSLPGLCCGTMFSVGNLATVYSAIYLSQSVGVALTNCSLLVASAWSIFYYREIEGRKRTFAWLGAAVVTLCACGMLGMAAND